MAYYSWPVKALQIAMTSWLGLVLQGTNNGGFVPREPKRAVSVLGGLTGRQIEGVRSHIWSLYLTQSNHERESTVPNIIRRDPTSDWTEPEIRARHGRLKSWLRVWLFFFWIVNKKLSQQSFTLTLLLFICLIFHAVTGRQHPMRRDQSVVSY